MESETVFQCPEMRALYPNLSNLEATALVVISFAFVGFVTVVLLKIYTIMDAKQPKWWSFLIKTWPLLGLLVYVPVGYNSHFVEVDEIMCIVPPNGTWGWWYLPVSEKIQLVATGYAEILGGLTLAISGMLDGKFRPLRQQVALCLFVMTIGMTFANVYMLTHGAWGYEMEEPFPLVLHAARYVVQGLWLSNLWYMATHDVLGGRAKVD